MPGVDYFDIQENTFRRWCNDYLSGTGNGKTTPTGRYLTNLKEDLKDGLALIELLGILSGKEVGKYNKHPKLDIQKLENLSLAIAFITAQGIKLVNISAEDINSGNMRLILGLIWTLILRFEINGGKVGGTSDDKEGTDALLQWVQSKLPDYDIKGFTKDWNDGRALCGLVNALLPSQCADHKDLDPANKEANLRQGMDAAHANLAIDKLLLPEEMAHPKVDKLAVMTYIAQFKNVSQDMLAQLGDHTLTKAFGPGLVESILGQEAKFEVHCPGCCTAAPTVEISPDTPASVVPKGDGQHEVAYTPGGADRLEVCVLVNGSHIPGSPFTVPVLEQESLGGEGKIRVFFSTTHATDEARQAVAELENLLVAKKVHLRPDFEPWHPVDLMTKDDRDAVFRKAGTRSLPIVFVDDKYVGGTAEVRELEEQGRLDQVLHMDQAGDLMTVEQHIQRLKAMSVSEGPPAPSPLAAQAPPPAAPPPLKAPAEPAAPPAPAAAPAAAPPPAAPPAAAPPPADPPAATPPPAAPPAAAPPPPPSADIPSGSSTSEECYTLAQLQGDFAGLGVDAATREAYLADHEFQGLFGVTKEEFYKLPKWKQTGKKKEHGLF